MAEDGARALPGACALNGDDYAQIQLLCARYNHCADGGDAEGWAACFAADGVFRLAARDFSVRGHDALAEFQRKARARRGALYRRHWTGSLLVEMDGADAATARSYFQAFNGEPGKLPVLADSGVYEDRLIRTADGWRFAERVVSFDTTLG